MLFNWIKEYKEMVQGFHKQGLGVIMDVVYNHTYDIVNNCFQKCVPFARQIPKLQPKIIITAITNDDAIAARILPVIKNGMINRKLVVR